MKKIALFGLLVLLFFSQPLLAADGYLTVLMYHRFDAGVSISVPMDTFKEQINYLQENDYEFLSLQQVSEHIKNDTPFPEKAILLTVDDGYRCAYELVHPYLQEKNIPWVLYVYTDAIDKGFGSTLSWQQVKELAEAGVSVENHSASHSNFISIEDKNDTWIEKEILRPQRRITEKTGQQGITFALPYGGYDRQTLDIFEQKTDYEFIMGTDPGVVAAEEGPFLLKRMGIVQSTSMQRFIQNVSRLNLTVKEISLPPGQRLNELPEKIEIQLFNPDKISPGQINIFISGLGAQQWEWTDRTQGRLRVNVDGELTNSWNRLIITARDRESGKFRYYSQGIVYAGKQ